ncbi:tyrosine-protein phosphatase [uncultured Alistipes sp.]|jgi:protein tyrosine/serine phosphatase|uniref:tyrosine-protein phosphatase n=1 Tax=uncultured Alistipes sp. TaxID=538949 RepID=UPI0025CD19AC|nr:tyrosine-protein phosphatase [uncultured Alistipes sp.]
MKKLLLLPLFFSLLFASCDKSDKDNAPRTPGYAGEDVSAFAAIERNQQTGAFTLVVNEFGTGVESADWSLYAGATVETIDLTAPVMTGHRAGEYIIPTDNASRLYFQLVTSKGKAILSEKHLPMAGGFNYRDMGGMKTSNGKFVKWGKLFRADEMKSLTESDLTYLAGIPIVSVVDFRSMGEVEEAPDVLPESVKTIHYLSVNAGNIPFDDGIYRLTPDQAIAMLKEVNEILVTDANTIAQYKEFFRLLQNSGDVPLVYHCTSGKDRTGMAAALILSALGVDEEAIYEDYLLSNVYLEKKNSRILQYLPDVLKPTVQNLLGVRKEYLQAGIDRIKKDHGSVENYLTKVLNVDIAKFRRMYLY